MNKGKLKEKGKREGKDMKIKEGKRGRKGGYLEGNGGKREGGGTSYLHRDIIKKW